MAIYSKCPHKMKASRPPFLCSIPKTCSIDHGYSPDTHLHWASWKDMFENVFPLKETKFHMPSIFCSLFLSVSWVNSHCTLCYPRTGKTIHLLNWTFFIHRFLWKRNNIFFQSFLFGWKGSLKKVQIHIHSVTIKRQWSLHSHLSVTLYVHFTCICTSLPFPTLETKILRTIHFCQITISKYTL